ncbi:hypothetical protein LZ31DRAFT_143544 [Colletotrichum somersetense]|nr:hypothetical protein LZ31DRAFT_143544 [Colletotrichum somersetense]
MRARAKTPGRTDGRTGGLADGGFSRSLSVHLLRQGNATGVVIKRRLWSLSLSPINRRRGRGTWELCLPPVSPCQNNKGKRDLFITARRTEQLPFSYLYICVCGVAQYPPIQGEERRKISVIWRDWGNSCPRAPPWKTDGRTVRPLVLPFYLGGEWKQSKKKWNQGVRVTLPNAHQTDGKQARKKERIGRQGARARALARVSEPAVRTTGISSLPKGVRKGREKKKATGPAQPSESLYYYSCVCTLTLFCSCFSSCVCLGLMFGGPTEISQCLGQTYSQPALSVARTRSS